MHQLHTSHGRFQLVVTILVLLWHITVSGAARAANPASLRDEITAFASRLDKLPKGVSASYRRSRWLDADSPWAPYRRRQFTEGLSPGQLQRHTGLVERGECRAAAELEFEGFLALHEEIARDLEDPAVRHQFDTIIAPLHSHANRRCRAIRVLLPLIAKSTREGWPIAMTPTAETPIAARARRHAASLPLPQDFLRMRPAVRDLAILAICRHDTPSMRFIVRHARPLMYYRSARAEGFYLLYLARKSGIDIPDFESLVTTRRPGVSPLDVALIKQTFANMSLEAASHRLWYRNDVCSREPLELR